jgi:hypothetical protein
VKPQARVLLDNQAREDEGIGELENIYAAEI